jgi:hypothetical protein
LQRGGGCGGGGGDDDDIQVRVKIMTEKASYSVLCVALISRKLRMLFVYTKTWALVHFLQLWGKLYEMQN